MKDIEEFMVFEAFFKNTTRRVWTVLMTLNTIGWLILID